MLPIPHERFILVSQNERTSLAYIVRDEKVEQIPTVDEYKSNHEYRINMIDNGVIGQLTLEDMYDEKNVRSMPDRFNAAIFQYSCPSLDINKLPYSSSDFSNVLNFCLNQWELLVVADCGQRLKCCCSHAIMCLNFYKNVLNDNVLMIGSDCIKKFTKKTKIHNDYMLYDKLFKKCAHCNRKILATETLGGCCQNCQQFKKSNNRPCSSCFRMSSESKCNLCRISNSPDNIIIKADFTSDVFTSNDITSNDITSQAKLLLLNYKKLCTKCSKDFYSVSRIDCVQCLEKERDEKLEQQRQQLILKQKEEEELKRQKEEELRQQREELKRQKEEEFRQQSELRQLALQREMLQQQEEYQRQKQFLQKKCWDCPILISQPNSLNKRCDDCHSKWLQRKCLDCNNLLSQTKYNGDRCIECHRKWMHKTCSGCGNLYHKYKLTEGLCNSCHKNQTMSLYMHLLKSNVDFNSMSMSMSMEQICFDCKAVFNKATLIDNKCQTCTKV